MRGASRSQGGTVRAAAIAGLLVLLLAAQALLQRSFERSWPPRDFEQLLYLPAGRHLKAFTLGFSTLAADLLWIKAIGYFGEHSMTDKNYPWLFHILDVVTTLDPPFRYPYLFGGVVLSVQRESVPESNELLIKGMGQYPGEWRFPFYLGFNYFYYLQDAHHAALFMRYAASLPGRPEYLPRLAASLLAESGRVDIAIRFLETLAEGARDESVRADIQEKIDALRSGRLPEALKAFLSGSKK